MEKKLANSAKARSKFFFAIHGPAMCASCAIWSRRSSSVCPQIRIEPHHLPPELFRGVVESAHQPYGTLHEARSAYEREFILRKLQENRWNMTQTAAAIASNGPTSTQNENSRHRSPGLIVLQIVAQASAGACCSRATKKSSCFTCVVAPLVTNNVVPTN